MLQSHPVLIMQSCPLEVTFARDSLRPGPAFVLAVVLNLMVNYSSVEPDLQFLDLLMWRRIIVVATGQDHTCCPFWFVV